MEGGKVEQKTVGSDRLTDPVTVLFTGNINAANNASKDDVKEANYNFIASITVSARVGNNHTV